MGYPKKSSDRPDGFDLLTVSEFALPLGVNPETVNRWRRAGKIKAFRVTKKIFYPRSELERLLKEANV